MDIFCSGRRKSLRCQQKALLSNSRPSALIQQRLTCRLLHRVIGWSTWSCDVVHFWKWFLENYLLCVWLQMWREVEPLLIWQRGINVFFVDLWRESREMSSAFLNKEPRELHVVSFKMFAYSGDIQNHLNQHCFRGSLEMWIKSEFEPGATEASSVSADQHAYCKHPEEVLMKLISCDRNNLKLLPNTPKVEPILLTDCINELCILKAITEQTNNHSRWSR